MLAFILPAISDTSYVQPSSFSCYPGDEVTKHDELVAELSNLNDRISKLEAQVSKLNEHVDQLNEHVEVLGLTASFLIKKVDPQSYEKLKQL